MVVSKTEIEACSICALPFANPDVLVISYGSAEKRPDMTAPEAIFHVPCFTDRKVVPGRAAWLGICLFQSDGAPRLPDLEKEVAEFGAYVKGRTNNVVPALAPREFARKWPNVERLVASQRELISRRAN